MRSSSSSFLFAFVIVVLTFSAILSPGQDSSTGSVRGIVLDPAGARIGQASVAIVNSATGTRYSTITDSEGHFAVESLPPGDYSVRVEADAMSPQITPQLHVDVGGVAELQFRLRVAGAQESLSVSAAPAAVETKPAAVSTLLDERSMTDFPLTVVGSPISRFSRPVSRRTLGA